MTWILLLAAAVVGGVFNDEGARSMFDQPTQWGRVVVVCVLIVAAVVNWIWGDDGW